VSTSTCHDWDRQEQVSDERSKQVATHLTCARTACFFEPVSKVLRPYALHPGSTAEDGCCVQIIHDCTKALKTQSLNHLAGVEK
jgi:hypothetical protein